MKKYHSSLMWAMVLMIGISTALHAQPAQEKSGKAKEENAEKPVPEAQESITHHSIKIDGKNINYTANGSYNNS